MEATTDPADLRRVTPQEGGGPDRNAAVSRVAAAEDPSKVAPRDAQSALDWFLSEEPEDYGYEDVDLNVGGPIGSGREKWVRFRVGSISRDDFNQIRKQAEREGRDGAELDTSEVNLRTAVRGLVDPDLSKSENRRVRGQQYMDPGDALLARFAHKQGLVDQIANKVVEVSGFDTADVREVRAGKT